jgi:multidrug efflux pump
MFIALKPLKDRAPAGEIVARLRTQLAKEPGVSLWLVPVQDVRIGGRQGTGSYQYTLQSDDLDALRIWTVRLQAALQSVPQLTDVSTDQETRGLQTTVVIDRARPRRASASRPT